mmetsp:Transcript_10948/g.33325  ORF Transcript_10948/g.33325 Transcript_10948/m.33325 type:complete len:459 (-) Transcript_10948:53-1429(-)
MVERPALLRRAPRAAAAATRARGAAPPGSGASRPVTRARIIVVPSSALAADGAAHCCVRIRLHPGIKARLVEAVAAAQQLDGPAVGTHLGHERPRRWGGAILVLVVDLGIPLIAIPRHRTGTGIPLIAIPRRTRIPRRRRVLEGLEADRAARLLVAPGERLGTLPVQLVELRLRGGVLRPVPRLAPGGHKGPRDDAEEEHGGQGVQEDAPGPLLPRRRPHLHKAQQLAHGVGHGAAVVASLAEGLHVVDDAVDAPTAERRVERGAAADVDRPVLDAQEDEHAVVAAPRVAHAPVVVHRARDRLRHRSDGPVVGLLEGVQAGAHVAHHGHAHLHAALAAATAAHRLQRRRPGDLDLLCNAVVAHAAAGEVALRIADVGRRPLATGLPVIHGARQQRLYALRARRRHGRRRGQGPAAPHGNDGGAPGVAKGYVLGPGVRPRWGAGGWPQSAGTRPKLGVS